MNVITFTFQLANYRDNPTESTSPTFLDSVNPIGIVQMNKSKYAGWLYWFRLAFAWRRTSYEQDD